MVDVICVLAINIVAGEEKWAWSKNSDRNNKNISPTNKRYDSLEDLRDSAEQTTPKPQNDFYGGPGGFRPGGGFG